MIFTTVKKRVEKEELFPNYAVMTLLAKLPSDAAGNTKFSLNKKAMELFGFPLNTPNVSRIANGFDESNNIILATIDTNDMYTNNITAKNDFSSQLLASRLAKQYKLNEIELNHFQLNLLEESVSVKFVGLDLINSVNVPEEQSGNEDALELNKFVMPELEDLIAIENFYADEIAQQEELELLPEPPEEIILIDTKEEPVIIEQIISEEVIFDKIPEDKLKGIGIVLDEAYKKVINTENW